MGFWNELSFGWMYTPVKKARNGGLGVDELYFPDEFTTDHLYDDFDKNWAEEMQSEKTTGKAPSLVRTLYRSYGKAYMLAGLCKLLWAVLVITGAFYFVRSLLLFADSKAPYDKNWHGWVLTGFFFLDAYLLGLALQRMGYLCVVSGLRVRCAISNAICRKAFAMAHIHAEDAADVVSFMASDLMKVYNGMQELHYLWTAPFEAAAILALLATLTLQYATPGIGILLIVLPLQYVFGWMIAKHKYANSANTSARGGIVQEVLPAMKLVKYYCWERFFEDKVNEIRRREEKIMFKVAVIKVINVAMVFAVPPTTAYVIFVAYEFSFKRLVAAVAFTTLSLFNILRFPLVVLPKALRAASEGYTSIKRIEKFLMQPVEVKQKAAGAPGIRMDRAVFSHGKEAHGGFKVRVPKFECRPGEVVAIVGRVGAGKSSLLNALLGNMECMEGSYQIGGRTAYVPQTAWVQNLSIRDNITFGLPYDEEKYRQVIHACALEMDLEILPLGDGSFGGLRGINLSGGQRQRLNLARAAYFDAETVLLDNALSAVDHHTAEHIFDNLIKGMFHDKAVVLITHQLNFLSRCDKVCVMDHGDVHYFGPWNAAAQAMLGKYLPVNTAMGEHAAEDKKAKAKVAKAAPKAEQKRAALPISKNTLMGGLNAYMVQAGLCLFPFVLIFFLAAQICRQMSDYWIRQWVGDTLGLYDPKVPNDDQHGSSASLIYTQAYLGLVAGFIILMVFRGSFFFWWSLRCAQKFQRNMLRRVLNTPMSFLLVKPIGDLLISFTADQDMLDENLPDALHYAGIYGLILLSTAVTVSVAINVFAAFAVALVVVTFLALWLYLPASTAMKKLRGETQSATVGLVAEVLDGLQVIQAYNHEEHFVHEASARIDRNHRVLYNVECLNLWLAFYLDAYGAILVGAVCVMSVLLKDSLGAAVVGLAFSNTIQMLVFYTWSVRLITEAISLWASVEKISWLANHTPIDGTDDVNNDGTDIKTKMTNTELGALRVDNPDEMKLNWPTNGEITFQEVKMRYRPGANLALNGVNFHIQGREKVGVVGRTGSGKSTLLLALYRMFDLAGGRVLVDGVDVMGLSLRRLRLGLSIIPQEPVIFSGTVRENLDPYNEHPDADLWQALRDTGLDEEAKAVGGLTGHLDGTGSSSWSLGQMQLMCLARAALRKVPILCCDEATAAMDPHTEALVIKTIERLFGDRTIVTIAHRLDVVISADKVLVMEQGKVAEMDEPHTLLSNRDSWFSKLVDRGGAEAAAAMRTQAAEHARRQIR